MTIATPSSVEWDQKGRRIYIEGKEVRLSYLEYQLFSILAEEPGVALPYATIIDALDGRFTSDTIRVLAYRLRRKLGREILGTASQFGYRLDAELTLKS